MSDSDVILELPEDGIEPNEQDERRHIGGRQQHCGTGGSITRSDPTKNASTRIFIGRKSSPNTPDHGGQQ